MLLALVLASAQPDTMVVHMKEIVVTGTRTPQDILGTPAAISVVDRKAFDQTRNLSLKEALTGVPGVFVQSRGGAQDVRITIRGYGARGNGERSNSGNMRGIRVLTDGIPVTEPDGRTSLDLIDLGSTDRIEVVRSNASALYGNASGGVLNLRTNLDFTEPWVEFAERAGSFGYHREQGVVGFTAGRATGSFSLLNSTFQGWRAHSESFTTIGNLRVAVPLDDATRFGLLVDGVSNLNRYPGALTAAQFAADEKQANPTFVSRDERRRNRVARVAATFDRYLEGGQNLSFALWAEPKVLQRSERNRWRDFNRYHLGGNAIWSGAFTTQSGMTARTTVGGDESYQDGAIQFYNLGPGGTKSTVVFANKREGANSAGGFLQQSLSWDRWLVQASARYDNVWYISEDNVNPKLSATKRFTHITPKGSIAYRLERHTVYAALGGGVESPAFNEIDPPAPFDTLTSFNPFLEPMISTTYELGARGVLGNAWGAWRYDVALYSIDVKNDIVPFGGGAFFFTAGKSQRRGVEVGLDWDPVQSMTLSGSVSASKNEYVEYTNDLGNFDGNDIAGLPAVVFASAVAYRWPHGVTTSVSVEGNSEYFVDDANTQKAFKYGLLNASIGYEHPTALGSVRAFVAGGNLLDKKHIASVFINGVSGQFFEAGLPANVSAGVSLRFQ